MLAKLTKLVWTTNFDTLIADACAKVYDGTGALTTVALDAPALASEALSGQRWPVEVKLHGDFRSRRLKNTGDGTEQRALDVSAGVDAVFNLSSNTAYSRRIGA
jgi:hypothetical protein